MKVTKAHADRCVHCKAVARSDHLDPWWLKRVLFRKIQRAMVVTTLVWAILQTKNDEMPVKDVVRAGLCNEVIEVFALDDPDVLHLKSLRTCSLSHIYLL